MAFTTPFICTLLGPAAFMLGACSLPTDEPQARVAPSFACSLDARDNGSATEITAIVRADQAVSGVYQLSVGQTVGGQTQINQGGPFEAVAGQRLTLSALTLSGAGLTGSLAVTADGTTVFCPITGPFAAH